MYNIKFVPAADITQTDPEPCLAYVLNVIPAANDIVTWQFITSAITAPVITVSRDCSDFVGANAPISRRTRIYAAYYRRLTDKRNENKLRPVVLSVCQGILLMKGTIFSRNCDLWCHTVLSSRRKKSVKTRSGWQIRQYKTCPISVQALFFFLKQQTDNNNNN